VAKLKGPLFSLGASQKLGKALVFFPWKGLNVVREYVIPSNPKTAGQTTQRGYLSLAVTHVHDAQSNVPDNLDEDDKSAYALWASVVQAATTWFNQAVKNYIDQKVAGKTALVYRAGKTTPGASKLDVEVQSQVAAATAGYFWYGTSKTALINSKVATVVGPKYSASLIALTTGVKYFWQFRPTTPAGCIGAWSGIYYSVPT